MNQSPITSPSTFLTTAQGYPAGLTNAFNPLAANISYIPRDTRDGYVQNWFFSIQREIAHDMVFDIAYVGNRSNKLILFADYNQARPQDSPTGNLSLAGAQTGSVVRGNHYHLPLRLGELSRFAGETREAVQQPASLS